MKKNVIAFAAIACVAAGCTYTQQPKGKPSLLMKENVSGSTNTLPFELEVFDDGGVNVLIDGMQPQSYPPRTADAEALKGILVQAPDPSVMGSTQMCLKSASFGTVTTVTYNGKTSGDISCPHGTVQAETSLFKYLNNLELILKLPLGRSHTLPFLGR